MDAPEAAPEGGTAAGTPGRGETVREVWFGEPVLCPVIGRRALAAETVGRPGPLIVEEMDCTVVVPPGWRAALDERGCILMTRRKRDGSD